MTFNRKQLKIVLTLGTGAFGSSNNNVLTLQGFRCMVEIEHAGGMQNSFLRAKIFGMTQSDMNIATTLQWSPTFNIKNNIDVYTIDGGTTTLVFSGNFVQAWGEYIGMPNVYFYVEALAGYAAQQTPIPPSSLPSGSTAEETIKTLGVNNGFKNVEINIDKDKFHPMSETYTHGTILEQMRQIGDAYGLDVRIDGDIVIVTEKNQPRINQPNPLISKETGMIGYPTFDGIGVIVRSYFNPDILFGATINIQSDVTPANGTWMVISLNHYLDSEFPNGRWLSIIRGNLIGLTTK
jgi:hypothetical protein